MESKKRRNRGKKNKGDKEQHESTSTENVQPSTSSKSEVQQEQTTQEPSMLLQFMSQRTQEPIKTPIQPISKVIEEKTDVKKQTLKKDEPPKAEIKEKTTQEFSKEAAPKKEKKKKNQQQKTELKEKTPLQTVEKKAEIQKPQKKEVQLEMPKISQKYKSEFQGKHEQQIRSTKETFDQKQSVTKMESRPPLQKFEEQQKPTPSVWEQKSMGKPMEQQKPTPSVWEQKSMGKPMEQQKPTHSVWEEKSMRKPMEQQKPIQSIWEQKPMKQQMESKNKPVQRSTDVKAPVKTMQTEQLSGQISKLAQDVENICIVSRPNLKQCGIQGIRIKLQTNYVELKLNRRITEAYHYDIAINWNKSNPMPKRLVSLVWNAYARKKFPNSWPAFDGVKNLYSAKKLLNEKSITENFEYFEEYKKKPEIYKIQIQLAAVINLQSLIEYMNNPSTVEVQSAAIQCLDIVLRMAPATQFIKCGRSFFTKPNRQFYLGSGMELFYGFLQSAVLGWRPLLNIDVAHKAFPVEQSLLEIIAEYNRCRVDQLRNERFDDRLSNYLHEAIKNLNIIYEPGPNLRELKKYMGLDKNAFDYMFDLKKDANSPSKRISVYDYFSKEKNLRIRFPDYPLVCLGNKSNAYPLEFCRVAPNQITNRQLNEEQTRNLIKEAATKPFIRRNKIIESLNKADYNKSPYLNEFGLSVGGQFIEVDGRIIKPPNLKYMHRIVEPQQGQWRHDMFLKPIELTRWFILNLDERTRDENLHKLADELIKEGKKIGMNISKVSKVIKCNFRREKDMLDNFRDLTEKFQAQLVIVVFPNFGNIYAKIKSIAEIQTGVLTQCLKSNTVHKIFARGLDLSTINNILLKINTKLNGENHQINLDTLPKVMNNNIMFIGADVTHPSPDQKKIPSVAAVTASYNKSATAYSFCWRLQPPRVEIIQDLKEIVKQQIRDYLVKNKKLDGIIMFRDGVSDGQFQQVLNYELQAIKSACREMQCSCKITFLVVQKRHHTRFFITNDRDGDRNGNIKPGTCVDTEITDPRGIDFYLCSHQSIQGTARPSRYRVLYDENNMTYDNLEELTYYLCHLFMRCNRTVSYPAPTYYAHLAAFRARHYIQTLTINNCDEKSELEKVQARNKINSRFLNMNPMFFI